MNILTISISIITLIIAVILYIKISLFPHRIIENLIRYDNEIYIKVNQSTFYTIRNNMIKHLSSDKIDEYTTTLSVMKYIHSTDITESAINKTHNRIINGITVDYINKQIEKIKDKQIISQTDETHTKDDLEEI